MNAVVEMAATPVCPYNLAATVVGLVVALAFMIGMQICVRSLMGDRLRKATPKELRWHSGFFLFMPIWGWLGVHLGHSYLERASPLSLWFCMMGYIAVVFLWLWVWTKFVSANV
jgi:hypothetical protein